MDNIKDTIAQDFLSRKVPNVAQQFKDLPQTGTYEEFEDLPYYPDIFSDHIQGYTQYHDGRRMYYVFTQSLKGRSSGRIIIKKTPKGDCDEIETPDGWNHPGGIQAVGRFLFVPCEHGEESRVFVYDLVDSRLVHTLEFAHKAGCLGITDIQHGGTTQYLLVIGDNTVYHGYLMEIPKDGKMSTLKCESLGKFELTGLDGKVVKGGKIDCQGFGLVTEEGTGDVYMVALKSNGKDKFTYEDFAYLIKLKVDKPIGFHKDTIARRHLKNNGGVTGVAGSHFRWGAGIRVDLNNRLAVLVTSRNIIGKLDEKGLALNKLDTTWWI